MKRTACLAEYDFNSGDVILYDCKITANQYGEMSDGRKVWESEGIIYFLHKFNEKYYFIEY